MSRRSSLSALSLAAVSTPRSISKEEKEKENSRRTSPTKAAGLASTQGRTRPQTAQPKLHHECSKSEKARKVRGVETVLTVFTRVCALRLYLVSHVRCIFRG